MSIRNFIDGTIEGADGVLVGFEYNSYNTSDAVNYTATVSFSRVGNMGILSMPAIPTRTSTYGGSYITINGPVPAGYRPKQISSMGIMKLYISYTVNGTTLMNGIANLTLDFPGEYRLRFTMSPGLNPGDTVSVQGYSLSYICD